MYEWNVGGQQRTQALKVPGLAKDQENKNVFMSRSDGRNKQGGGKTRDIKMHKAPGPLPQRQSTRDSATERERERARKKVT